MKIIIILMLAEIFTLLMQRNVCENLLESRKQERAVQIIIWTVFLVTSNIGTFLWSWFIGVDLLLFLLLFMIVLSLLYEGDIRNKLKITAVFCVIELLADFFVYGMVEVLGNSVMTASEKRFLCIFISKLIWFIEVKIILLMRKRQGREEIGILDWAEVFLVPVSSIFIVILLFEPFSEKYQEFNLIAACLLLYINLFTFYLYGRTQERMLYRAEREFLIREKAGYTEQLKKSSEMQKQIQKSYHELKQTYLLVQTYLEQGAYDKIKDYYAEKIHVLGEKDNFSGTGNICFDTIVNYKAAMAKEEGIEIRPQFMIPCDVELEEQDICSLLGNLLDNAIEAAAEVEKDERIITFKAKMSGNNMYVELKNPYKGERKKKGEDYLTTKENDQEHGIGLKIVRDIIEKHNGTLDIEDRDYYFQVKLIVYDIGRL